MVRRNLKCDKSHADDKTGDKMRSGGSKKETLERTYQHLTNVKSAQDIYGLFGTLGYPEVVLFDLSAKRKKASFDFNKEDDQRIREIFSVLSFEDSVTGKRDKLPVFLLEVSTIGDKRFLRNVTKAFDDAGHFPCLLIFTVDYSEIVFIFPEREKIETGKHKLKITKLIVEKQDILDKKEYYSVIETLANIQYDNEAGWRDVWKKWRTAFSVERVTDDFFENYKNVFFALRNELRKQKVPNKESHEFTLQLLNRIMFIYFVSKKKWLEYPKFVEWLWNSYKINGRFGSDEFYKKWLKQVFLKAFNNKSGEITVLPDEVVRVISNMPYLNGGLFRENDLDSLQVEINDKMFQRIFDFFEKYNFTIKEDMPLESEVAVDPQMIGYVYESLANVAEEIYDRNDLGIFYTPRIEVDFMCKRSLVEYLSKSLPDIPKENFYHLVFDLPEEKEKIEGWFTNANLWRKLEEILDNLSVIDPACGSGAFLVGMLNVISEIFKLVYKHLERSMTDFQLKSRVIQYSLYGVDVMPWAIHAAELRLWLQLIVETEFRKDELRKHPLLPNLNLNLRIGDSLVQEVGGITFSLRTNGLALHLKKKLENLKQEKRKYFENSPTARFKTPDEVKEEEVRLFEEIIKDRIDNLQSDIEKLEIAIKQDGKQTTLFDEPKNEAIEDKQKREEKQLTIQKNIDEINKLKKIRQHLEDPEKRPFVWDIDFAEIFSEQSGFDIVIGNPPYVRQEMISPPNKLKSEVSVADKKNYKEKLLNSVRTQFSVIEKIDKKSDYYVYFYFHGLGLLNKKGTFCFITSNSWLDVGYGSELQEFLCKYVPILAIYDNPKRSFAHADVNTIIALFGAPDIAQKTSGEWFSGLDGGKEASWSNTKYTAKFVMFRKPFEEVLSSKNLIEIEDIRAEIKGGSLTDRVKNILTTQDYRVFPTLQEDLLNDGWGYPIGYKDKRFEAGTYKGNKWGGKYLRAPDIFYTLLKKGKGKFIRLGDIAEVRFGIKSGVNEFFYLNEEMRKKWNVEKQFLKPVIKSPRESKSIIINPKDLNFRVFMCSKSKLELRGTNALKYIEWGEKQKTENKILWCKVPSVSGRKYWYDLGSNWEPADCLWMESINDINRVYYNSISILESDKFYGITFKQGNKLNFAVSLNSTITCLFRELAGFGSLGEGVLKLPVYDVEDMPIVQIREKKEFALLKNVRPMNSIFEELGIDPSKPIRDQEPQPLSDRLELDKIIFDELDLTQEERKEVCWSVCELIKQRIDKAGSLRK